MRSTASHDSRRRALLRALGAAALASCGLALAAVLRERAALRALWGARSWLVILLLVVGSACGLALLLARRVAPARAGWDPSPLAPLRMAFVCVTLGWIVYAIFLQPYWMLTVAIAMSLSLGGFALLWLLAPPFLARLPRRLVSAADFASFQCCLLLVLAELAAGLYCRHSGLRMLDFGGLEAAEQIALWRLEPGTLRTGFPVNSRGDYDHEPSPPPRDHPLVVGIGDSFSASIVPHYAHFTTVAEELLPGVEVYNMGAPVIGPSEYLHLLRAEALPLRPDLVVIHLFVGNDIEQEVMRERRDRFPMRWFVREKLTLYLLTARLRRLGEEARRRPSDAAPLGASPGAIETARSGVLGRTELERRLPWLVDPLLEPPSFSPEAFEQLEHARAISACGAELDYGPCLERLDEIVAAAGEVPVALLLIPDIFQVEDELWERILARNDGSPLDRLRPQRELAAWCAARSVPMLDLLPRLRAVEALEDGDRHLYHLRDTHFNVRGNRVAGEALAEFLAELLGAARR